jgi:hypothetical protein
MSSKSQEKTFLMYHAGKYLAVDGTHGYEEITWRWKLRSEFTML